MTITLLLLEKIASLFIILFAGVLLVKLKLLKSSDSRTLSTLSVYIVCPCTIISAFEVDLSPEVISGFLLAILGSFLVHLVLFAIIIPLGKVLKLNSVEKLSMIYSNAGNLIIPLVRAILGAEWVIYSVAFIAVQQIFLWSHGRSSICGEKSVDFKSMLTNQNMIAVYLGIAIFLSGFRFPGFIQTSIDSIGGLIGPFAMLVSGMLIGSKNLLDIFRNKRAWLVLAFRLILIPLVMLCLLKFTGLSNLTNNGSMILMITFMAAITPPASTVTQMAVVYHQDADYASAVNVLCTLCCLITMPLMIWLYQL